MAVMAVSSAVHRCWEEAQGQWSSCWRRRRFQQPVGAVVFSDAQSRSSRQRSSGASRGAPRHPLARTALTTTVLLVLLLASGVAGIVSPALRARGGGSGFGGNGASTGARRGAGEHGGDVPPYARSPPRDGVLYDELEVHWGASAREIKKAYYRLAVMHHPDKRPGDTKAEDRFKRVSEAYQILQDDRVRERYHKKGIASLEDDGLSWSGGSSQESGAGDRGSTGGRSGSGGGQRRRVDPMEVFRMFLGGGMFEHLIGPLSPRMVPVVDPDYHHRKARGLAEDLERRLEVHVRGNSHWFDQAAWDEAIQLREQSMGRQILHTVGYVYKNYALRSLGKLAPSVLQPQAIRGKMKYVSDQAHRMNNLLAAVSSTTRLYVHLQTRKPDVQNGHQYRAGSKGTSERESQEEETVAIVLEALWRVHRVDVEHTVQRACKMVLRDPRVPPSVLKRRAEALMRLGRIFSAAAKGKNPEPGTFHFVENTATAADAGTAAAFSYPPTDSSSEFSNDYSAPATGGAAGGWSSNPGRKPPGQQGQQEGVWPSTTPASSDFESDLPETASPATTPWENVPWERAMRVDEGFNHTRGSGEVGEGFAEGTGVAYGDGSKRLSCRGSATGSASGHDVCSRGIETMAGDVARGGENEGGFSSTAGGVRSLHHHDGGSVGLSADEVGSRVAGFDCEDCVEQSWREQSCHYSGFRAQVDAGTPQAHAVRHDTDKAAGGRKHVAILDGTNCGGEGWTANNVAPEATDGVVGQTRRIGNSDPRSAPSEFGEARSEFVQAPEGGRSRGPGRGWRSRSSEEIVGIRRADLDQWRDR